MPLPAEAATAMDPPTPVDGGRLTLAAFVQRNRNELILRCRAKAAQRNAAASPPADDSTGVPRFLQQLVDVLHAEQHAGGRENQHVAVPTPSAADIGQAAAVHGAALLQQGLRVDQVVREYGDVCQAVTQLAMSQDVPFAIAEFATLNRCLDDAIAEAVTAHQDVAQHAVLEQQSGSHRRLHLLMHDHQRLVGIARHSFQAIQSGQVGINGATSALLAHTLEELLHLSEERLPRIVDALRG